MGQFAFWGIGFLLIFIPLVIIHMRCYSLNDGMEMIYDDMEKIIVIRDTKKIQFQNLDEMR